MKERPLLLSDEMVRAVLDGRKKRTWRPVKHPLIRNHANNWLSSLETYPGEWVWFSRQNVPPSFAREIYEPGTGIPCPYGKVGDRLWVREAWRWFDALSESDQDGVYSGYQYRADTHRWDDELIKWRPSIHMPRAASRILLEITSVHPERLFDISEKDALAEGVARFRPVPGDGPAVTKYRDYMADAKGAQGLRVQKYPFECATDSYFSLVESIYGRGFIDSNPWGWAISFRRIQMQEPDYDNAAKDYSDDQLHLDQPTPYDP